MTRLDPRCARSMACALWQNKRPVPRRWLQGLPQRKLQIDRVQVFRVYAIQICQVESRKDIALQCTPTSPQLVGQTLAMQPLLRGAAAGAAGGRARRLRWRIAQATEGREPPSAMKPLLFDPVVPHLNDLQCASA